MRRISLRLATAAAFLVVSQLPGLAQDSLKIAVPQRGAWDTSITEIGNRAGLFKKHGIDIDLLFTGGGADRRTPCSPVSLLTMNPTGFGLAIPGRTVSVCPGQAVKFES